jgi:hypothetical protein
MQCDSLPATCQYLDVRVPDFPRKPIEPVVRLSQFRDGGYVLISHCSSGIGHQHTLDYDALIAQHGDAEVDYAFKVGMTCPDCGAPGGGMTVLPPGPQTLS